MVAYQMEEIMSSQTTWRHKTIEQMEETAKNEADGSCSKRIRGEYLEVRYVRPSKRYVYVWGKNYVERSTAKNIVDSAD